MQLELARGIRMLQFVKLPSSGSKFRPMLFQPMLLILQNEGTFLSLNYYIRLAFFGLVRDTPKWWKAQIFSLHTKSHSDINIVPWDDHVRLCILYIWTFPATTWETARPMGHWYQLFLPRRQLWCHWSFPNVFQWHRYTCQNKNALRICLTYRQSFNPKLPSSSSTIAQGPWHTHLEF